MVADEEYLRESILFPSAKIVAGYDPIMPTFKGQLTEEQILQLHRLHQVSGSHRKEGSTGMSTTAVEATTGVNYLNVNYGIKSWLLTTDHKRIALLYLVSITFFFLIGGAAAVLMRLHLIEPQGALVEPDTYNKLFSMHGIIMVFFFLIPSIPAVLGNFLVPMMIGARDLAFPRINLLSWYIYIRGWPVHPLRHSCRAAWIPAGRSTRPYSTTYCKRHVMAAALGVFITGFSSILTGLNFIVTIHKMRAPGLTWFRLPLFIWAMYATSIILILGTPVVAITIALVGLERLFHVGIFDPALGGDPDPVPAPLLVLFAPGGLHHDSAFDGCGQRTHHLLLAQADFRLQLHRLFQRGDRRDLASWSGAITCSSAASRSTPALVFSALSFAVAIPFRHQGLQLDGHALQRLDFLPGAHALCHGLHRAIHHGRADGPCSWRRSPSTSTCTTPTS